MSTKVQFIREIHNKIQINKKKTLKKCKKNNIIQKDKNIERVQDKQQETILKWNLIYDEL
jgi:hypothetical protein